MTTGQTTTSTKVKPKDTQNRKQNYWNKTQSGRRDLTWTWLNSTWRVMTVAGGLLAQPDGNNAAPWTHQRHPADEMIQLCRNHHFHKLSTEHWLTWWDTLAIHIILKQSDFKLIEKLKRTIDIFPSFELNCNLEQWKRVKWKQEMAQSVNKAWRAPQREHFTELLAWHGRSTRCCRSLSDDLVYSAAKRCETLFPGSAEAKTHLTLLLTNATVVLGGRRLKTAAKSCVKTAWCSFTSFTSK